MCEENTGSFIENWRTQLFSGRRRLLNRLVKEGRLGNKRDRSAGSISPNFQKILARINLVFYVLPGWLEMRRSTIGAHRFGLLRNSTCDQQWEKYPENLYHTMLSWSDLPRYFPQPFEKKIWNKLAGIKNFEQQWGVNSSAVLDFSRATSIDQLNINGKWYRLRVGVLGFSKT